MSWWRFWQRSTARSPFPEAWEPILRQRCRHANRLPAAVQPRFRQDIQFLVNRKHWEGCQGLVITPEVQVTIAAQAALLGLGFDESPFGRLRSILVYPDSFLAPSTAPRAFGVIDESWEPHLGEAWQLSSTGGQGPVILAWSEIAEQTVLPLGTRNVVIHEFAHLLDMQHDGADGIPPLAHVGREDWHTAFLGEYRRFARSHRRQPRTVLDPYGAESPAEFFAVAAESFFEQPEALRAGSPTLYDLLCEFYRQDPARWPQQ